MSIIDLKFLYQISKGKEEVITPFVNNYLEEKKIFIENLNSCIKQKDEKGIKTLAHNFKSSAKIVGIALLYEKLEILEKNKKWDSIVSVSKDIHSITEKADKELTKWLEERK